MFKQKEGDFLGSPVVKTSPSNAGDASLISGQGAKIPHASGTKNQSIKQKQYCNKFNKDFKNDPYQTILKTEEEPSFIIPLEQWRNMAVWDHSPTW